MKLIQQGAEAKIFLTNNSNAEQVIQKQRIQKGYRHPELDKQIRTRRTRSEAKILTKAIEAKANVPKVISTNKFDIEIEYINGDRLSETLNDYPEQKQFQTMQALGTQTAILHKHNIIHGDLTTSNTILQTTSPQTPQKQASQKQAIQKIYIIDFGLSFISTKIEDKAVDLHLIKQALEAKHFQNHQDLFQQFLKTYKDQEVIQRLEVVEKRGRYKH